MKRTCLLVFILMLNLPPIFAQGTAFTYQGRLNSAGSPAEGLFDFRFRLASDPLANNYVGSAYLTNSLGVTNGLFITTMDFGNVFAGGNYWLEVDVRAHGGGAYTVLSPLQAITPAPYATYALSAGGGGVIIQQNTNGGPNIIQGAPGNYISGGVIGGVIAGGGATNFLGLYLTNAVTGDFGTVSGGAVNVASNTAATVSGGVQNLASGESSTVSGGASNLATNNTATVGGGSGNTAGGSGSTVGGGNSNIANGGDAVVAGGYLNSASGFIATVAGGEYNSAGGDQSVVGGGELNNAGNSYATIGGGSGNLATGDHSTVGGGLQNVASGDYSAVSGGYDNTASGYAATASGYNNVAIGYGATASGHSNQAGSYGAAVGGGETNTASGNYSTVCGGQQNTASGLCATACAGFNNTAGGAYSFAVGANAQAVHAGSFVWADPIGEFFSSTANNQFSVRATGGVRFVSASSGGTPTAGVSLAAGGGSWSSLSDRNAKENLQSVDAQGILQKIAALPLATWNYKTQARDIRHIGPMAQDFYAAFAVGEDDRHITEIDESGVALAAIQGLNQQMDRITRNSDAQIRKLEAENADLKARLQELEKIVLERK